MRVKDEQKYEAICNASIDLINEVGFANTSMSKIAKRAGVSPATIYVYFENKDDLLNKLYIRVWELLSHTMIPGKLDHKDVEQSMKTLWLNQYTTLINDRRSFEFIEQFKNSPLINEVCQEEAWTFFNKIKDLLDKAIDDGVVKDIDHEILCSFTFAAIHDLVKKQHVGHFTINKDDIDIVLSLAWSIMKK